MKNLKIIWGILTGNMVTGYISIGTTPEGRSDIMVSSYKAMDGMKADYSKTVIIPTNTIVFIPRLTEGKVETPDEYNSRFQ